MHLAHARGGAAQRETQYCRFLTWPIRDKTEQKGADQIAIRRTELPSLRRRVRVRRMARAPLNHLAATHLQRIGNRSRQHYLICAARRQ